VNSSNTDIKGLLDCWCDGVWQSVCVFWSVPPRRKGERGEGEKKKRGSGRKEDLLTQCYSIKCTSSLLFFRFSSF